MTARRPLLAAPVSGFPAVFLAALLRAHGAEYLRRLEASMRLHPDYVAQVRQVWRAIDQAEEEWLTWCASADGNTEVPVTEAGPSSTWITTREAAEMLDVSERRVRQLLDEGRVSGVRAGRAWQVDRASVELHGAGERGAA